MQITMNLEEIEAALQAAFKQCDAANCPLTEMQKEILLQVVGQVKGNSLTQTADIVNPLDELTLEERQAFLEFVSRHEQDNRAWKVQLLNDWLHDNDSGTVQFIRDRYGLQWLNSIEPYHLLKYAAEAKLKLKVGDKIEVCNSLWEWVQEDGPCTPEWFTCIVISVEEINNGDTFYTNCIVRFLNGAEYEIQGIYDWNKYNWRFPQSLG